MSSENQATSVPITMTLSQALHLYNTGFPITATQTIDGFLDRFEPVDDERRGVQDMVSEAARANEALTANTEGGGSLLWVGDNYLAALCLRTALRASGHLADIVWDLSDPEDGAGGCEHVIVTSYRISG